MKYINKKKYKMNQDLLSEFKTHYNKNQIYLNYKIASVTQTNAPSHCLNIKECEYCKTPLNATLTLANANALHLEGHHGPLVFQYSNLSLQQALEYLKLMTEAEDPGFFFHLPLKNQ